MTQTILIVEDDRETLEEVAEALSEEGYRTLKAGNAAEMWGQLKNQPADLILLDLILPDENGLNLARKIRQRSDVGIIIVSGKTAEVDRVVGLELGADDYITKPFSPRELLARVRAVLRRTEGKSYREGDALAHEGDSPILEFDKWRLDTAAHSLFDPAGKEVNLTTAEFKVLLIFANNPNRVFTRDQLIDRLHGQDWAGYDRSIDGLVSRLRRKVHSGPKESEYIKTVRGAGYMFTPKVGSSL